MEELVEMCLEAKKLLQALRSLMAQWERAGWEGHTLQSLLTSSQSHSSSGCHLLVSGPAVACLSGMFPTPAKPQMMGFGEARITWQSPQGSCFNS